MKKVTLMVKQDPVNKNYEVVQVRNSTEWNIGHIMEREILNVIIKRAGYEVIIK